MLKVDTIKVHKFNRAFEVDNLYKVFHMEFKGNNLRNTSLAAKGATPHRLQRCTTCKIQYGCQGAEGVWKYIFPEVLGILSNFR